MTKVIACLLLLFFNSYGLAQSSRPDSNDRIDVAIIRSNQAYLAAVKSGNADSLFSSLSSMFDIYLDAGDYTKSFEFAEQLYNMSIESGNPNHMTISLINLGKLFAAIEDYPQALSYFRRAKSINLNRELTDGKKLDLYIGDAYAHSSQFDSAWYYYNRYALRQDADSSEFRLSTAGCHFMQGKFQQALENYESAVIDYGRPNIRALLGLAGIFEVINNPRRAMNLASQGIQLALKAGADQYIRDGYKIISDAHKRMGHIDSSNYYFRKYIVARDIVLNAKTRGRMAALTYEQNISRMSRENEVKEINLQKQVLIKNGLLAGVLLLILFAFLLSRYLIVKRKAEFRQRQIIENEFRIQKLAAEKITAELEHQKIALEITALRAQMNPHFIFNCLNSINRFIIGNEAEKAADYLTKFARLIRIVLEKSGYSTITLEEELQALTLYMDLEALRFETPFHYDIQSEGIDRNDLLIPSLILQPFVENAIWHGFQANQKKQGLIRIHLHLQENALHCEILDNGSGISPVPPAVAVIHGHEKSFGIKFTTDRLRLVGEPDAAAPVRIEALKDLHGKNVGTGVYLVIPIEYA